MRESRVKNEAEPRARHFVQDRGISRQRECRGRSETKTGRKKICFKTASGQGSYFQDVCYIHVFRPVVGGVSGVSTVRVRVSFSGRFGLRFSEMFTPH